MATIVVLGAGVSGHTAALTLRRKLGREHRVIVVSPNSKWNWIPSNIWVGVDRMSSKRVVFPLAPVYRRKGVDFRQAKAVAIRPEGDVPNGQGAVDIVYTLKGREGEIERVRYDYLINATGPQLNFGATPGLGPDNGHTVSVCTPAHAEHAAHELAAVIAKLKAGERQTLVIGVGHGTCTCEGAAFEYAFNVEHELRRAGVRDLAEVVYLTNEVELGDFGVGGMVFDRGGQRVTSEEWMLSLFRERGVKAITEAAVDSIEPGVIRYRQLDGELAELPYDFAMLLPPFRGVHLEAYDRQGESIHDALFAPSGFMKVDADYTQRPFAEWSGDDWPRTYQVPGQANVFAIGIAFAPPHQITEPRFTPQGIAIAPAPPRTGMPSGAMGKAVALSIVDMIRAGDHVATHTASMADLPAACIASMGVGYMSGSAAAMTMTPIVPDVRRHPEGAGRELGATTGEIGLAAHWVKRLLHSAFLYKAKAYPFWYLIPE